MNTGQLIKFNAIMPLLDRRFCKVALTICLDSRVCVEFARAQPRSKREVCFGAYEGHSLRQRRGRRSRRRLLGLELMRVCRSSTLRRTVESPRLHPSLSGMSSVTSDMATPPPAPFNAEFCDELGRGARPGILSEGVQDRRDFMAGPLVTPKGLGHTRGGDPVAIVDNPGED